MNEPEIQCSARIYNVLPLTRGSTRTNTLTLARPHHTIRTFSASIAVPGELDTISPFLADRIRCFYINIHSALSLNRHLCLVSAPRLFVAVDVIGWRFYSLLIFLSLLLVY